jgi:hypothetical protein
MNEDLDSILEQCLTQIAEGRARPESCLLAYPERADELRPLLQAAVELWSVPRPELSSEARDRIEAQILGTARKNPRPLPVPRLRLPIPAHWRWALLGVSAAIVLIFLVTVLVHATAGTLPGSPLYPVKTLTEQTWLWLTPAYAEPDLHLKFAERRLEEFDALASQGIFEPALLDAMLEEQEAALRETEGLPGVVALPLLEDQREFSARQRETLTRLQGNAPGPLQNRLTTALQAGDDLDQRAERVMELLRASEPAGQTWPAPGQTWPPPGQEGSSPGQEGSSPGHERKTPGVEPVPPGREGTSPGQERTAPGQTLTPPGRERTPEPTHTPKPPNPNKPPTHTPKPPNPNKPPTHTPEP